MPGTDVCNHESYGVWPQSSPRLLFFTVPFCRLLAFCFHGDLAREPGHKVPGSCVANAPYSRKQCLFIAGARHLSALFCCCTHGALWFIPAILRKRCSPNAPFAHTHCQSTFECRYLDFQTNHADSCSTSTLNNPCAQEFLGMLSEDDAHADLHSLARLIVLLDGVSLSDIRPTCFCANSRAPYSLPNSVANNGYVPLLALILY